LTGLALNLDPPDLGLPGSWDNRCELRVPDLDLDLNLASVTGI
jgi:hypothetical protein